MDWKLIHEAVTMYRCLLAQDYFLDIRMGAESPMVTNRARKYERLTDALEEIDEEIKKERENGQR